MTKMSGMKIKVSNYAFNLVFEKMLHIANPKQ